MQIIYIGHIMPIPPKKNHGALQHHQEMAVPKNTGYIS
jgi:hypothetical protein